MAKVGQSSRSKVLLGQAGVDERVGQPLETARRPIFVVHVPMAVVAG